MSVSHIAYSDESHQNTGRYGAISLISMSTAYSKSFRNGLCNIRNKYGIASECKWRKVSDSRHWKAAEEMITFAVDEAIKASLRIDVLIWDKHDQRHRIERRDDVANLERMYYHLFKNVLSNRWPDNSTWRLIPDENSAIDWETISSVLETVGSRVKIDDDPLFDTRSLALRMKRDFRIEDITQYDSDDEPCIQLADLMAGMAVYSRERYEIYCQRNDEVSGQKSLFEPTHAVSGTDKARCALIKSFSTLCKKRKMGVSLKSSNGLRTHNPRNPINFWWYTPQHIEDKAPTKT